MAKLCTMEVIERLLEVYSVKNMKELSIAITGKATSVANWKSRDAIPPEILFEVADQKGISLDWLAYGKENPTLDEMETELLNRFAQLSFSEKLDVFNRLQGVSAGSQHISHSTVGNVAGRDINIGKK
jgi:bacteriophage CI repressor helix-turn-helix domain|nr:MAG TPA: CI repressor [Caudoviricetes sp.]